MMAKVVDMELKKAFAELQEKKIDTAHQLRLADMQIDNLKRHKLHSEITEREISSLSPEVKTYESVGRMFLLNDAGTVKKNLQNKQQQAENQIQILENKKIYLEKSLINCEQNLRDMVNIRKDQDKDKS